MYTNDFEDLFPCVTLGLLEEILSSVLSNAHRTI